MNKNASVVKQIEPWLLMCFLGHYYYAKPGFGAIIYIPKMDRNIDKTSLFRCIIIGRTKLCLLKVTIEL